MRASRGLKWENKMYKLKRSIAVLQGYSLKSAGGSTALGGGGEREHDCFCVIQTSIFPVCVVAVITVRGSSSLFSRSTVEIISLCKLPPSLFVVVSAICDKRQIYRFGGERGERQTFTRPHPPLCTIPNGHSSVELLPSSFQQDCRGLA